MPRVAQYTRDATKCARNDLTGELDYFSARRRYLEMRSVYFGRDGVHRVNDEDGDGRVEE